MTEPMLTGPRSTDPTPLTDAERHVRSVATGYAGFYALMAVFCAVITFIPLNRRLDPEESPWPNVWGLNFRNESVKLGVTLIIAEVLILLIAAVVRPRGPILPIVVAIIAVPEVVILLSRTGIPDDVAISPAGTVAIVVGIVGALVALIAAVHVPRLEHRARAGGQ